MINSKALDMANLELAISQNNEKLKDYVNASNYTIKKYQKYVNTELDYGVIKVTDMTINETTPIVFYSVINGNIELSEKGFIKLQKGKTYAFHLNLFETVEDVLINLIDSSFNILADVVQSGVCSFIYHASNDIEVSFTTTTDTIIQSQSSYVNIYEINRQIIIDPVEYINETQGIEDIPVGYTISHAGDNTPKHYLLCDGSEYNIEDYPYLAQHFIDEYDLVNQFGGDGINTFAVPDYSVSIEEKWTADEKYIFKNTGVISTIAGRNYYKKNIGKAIVAVIIGNGTRPVIISTNPEYVIGYCSYNTNTLGSITATIQYNGLTWYIGHFPYGFSDSQSYSGFAVEVNCSELASTDYENTCLKVLQAANVKAENQYNKTYIKYEPTYYMEMHNTNYIQHSIYSQKEQIIGCWINGKPIYRLTVTGVSNSNLDSSVTITDLSEKNIEDIINIEGSMKGYISTTNNEEINTSYLIPGNVNKDGHQFDVFVDTGFKINCYTNNEEMLSRPVIVTIEYTKTIDSENSFNNSMLKESLIPASYTEEELQSAILDIVYTINKEPEIIIEDTPTVIPELYDDLDTSATIPEITDETGIEENILENENYTEEQTEPTEIEGGTE